MGELMVQDEGCILCKHFNMVLNMAVSVRVCKVHKKKR